MAILVDIAAGVFLACCQTDFKQKKLNQQSVIVLMSILILLFSGIYGSRSLPFITGDNAAAYLGINCLLHMLAGAAAIIIFMLMDARLGIKNFFISQIENGTEWKVIWDGIWKGRFANSDLSETEEEDFMKTKQGKILTIVCILLVIYMIASAFCIYRLNAKINSLYNITQEMQK